jgi:prolyl oligopeptidase
VFASDSRVDPLHARKMAAALQHATSSGRPVLMRLEREVGHGARSVSRTAQSSADALAFTAWATGLEPLRAERPGSATTVADETSERG